MVKKEVPPGDFGKNFNSIWEVGDVLETKGIGPCIAIVFYRKGHVGLGHYYRGEHGLNPGESLDSVDEVQSAKEMEKHSSGVIRYFLFAEDLPEKVKKSITTRLGKRGLVHDEKRTQVGRASRKIKIRLKKDQFNLAWQPTSTKKMIDDYHKDPMAGLPTQLGPDNIDTAFDMLGRLFKKPTRYMDVYFETTDYGEHLQNAYLGLLDSMKHFYFELSTKGVSTRFLEVMIEDIKKIPDEKIREELLKEYKDAKKRIKNAKRQIDRRNDKEYLKLIKECYKRLDELNLRPDATVELRTENTFERLDISREASPFNFINKIHVRRKILIDDHEKSMFKRVCFWPLLRLYVTQQLKHNNKELFKKLEKVERKQLEEDGKLGELRALRTYFLSNYDFKKGACIPGLNRFTAECVERIMKLQGGSNTRLKKLKRELTERAEKYEALDYHDPFDMKEFDRLQKIFDPHIQPVSATFDIVNVSCGVL